MEIRRVRYALLDELEESGRFVTVPDALNLLAAQGLFPEEMALRPLIRRLLDAGALTGDVARFGAAHEPLRERQGRRMFNVMRLMLDGRERRASEVRKALGYGHHYENLAALARHGWLSVRGAPQHKTLLLYRITAEGSRVFGHPLLFWTRVHDLLLTFAALSGRDLERALDVPWDVVKVLVHRFEQSGRLESYRRRPRTVTQKFGEPVRYYRLTPAWRSPATDSTLLPSPYAH